MNKQAYVYYSGDVQGVGFRYTAERVAGEFGVAGWVRNLPDGRVEVLAEGAEKAVNDFLSALLNHMGRYIRDVHIEWRQPTGEFVDFQILI